MTYTKKQFGSELKQKLLQKVEISKISEWAFDIYTSYGLEFEAGLDDFVLKLIAIQEGPEFFLSEEELGFLANELSSNGNELPPA